MTGRPARIPHGTWLIVRLREPRYPKQFCDSSNAIYIVLLLVRNKQSQSDSSPSIWSISSKVMFRLCRQERSFARFSGVFSESDRSSYPFLFRISLDTIRATQRYSSLSVMVFKNSFLSKDCLRVVRHSLEYPSTGFCDRDAGNSGKSFLL